MAQWNLELCKYAGHQVFFHHILHSIIKFLLIKWHSIFQLVHYLKWSWNVLNASHSWQYKLGFIVYCKYWVLFWPIQGSHEQNSTDHRSAQPPMTSFSHCVFLSIDCDMLGVFLSLSTVACILNSVRLGVTCFVYTDRSIVFSSQSSRGASPCIHVCLHTC